MDALVRRAARVILLDPSGAILLIHGRDPDDASAGTWWFTPGGGLEPGETAHDAARRELAEETGRLVDDLVPLPGVRETSFTFAGTAVRQTEWFFAARVPRFDVVTTGWTDLERRAHLELRWWAIEDLAGAGVRVFPEDLATRWRAAVDLLGPGRSD